MDVFEVSKVLKRKTSRGKPLYLIRWKNFGPEEDTWEPLENLQSCMKIIRSFDENNKDIKVSRTVNKRESSECTKKPKHNNTKKKLIKKERFQSANAKKKKLVLPEDSSSSDDDDILYSLNKDMNHNSHKNMGSSTSVSKRESRKLKKLKLDIQKATTANSGCPTNSKSSQKCRMRLIDSVKTKMFHTEHRPVSPISAFTSVKVLSSGSQMCNDIAQVSPNSARPATLMDSYFGDVPAASVVPMIPSSPSTISYKTLLDNLPIQLHPKKAKKGKLDGEFERCEVQRRQSVRSSECAFRYKNIVVKKCQGYTQMWLFSNTKQKNALNPQVIQEIISAMNYAKYDDSHLLMLSGLGSMFCSGVDLHYLLIGERKVATRRMVDAIRDLTKAFITFPKPVVAVVNGPAIGLGVGLLPLCDVIYASDKASCYLPYGRLGQTPEGCLSFMLPHLIGFPMANELLYAGRKITAIEAYQLGLVSQVFWPTSMMQDVIPRVQNMAGYSAKAQEATKLLIRSHLRTKLELTCETECNLLYEHWNTAESSRFILSYLEDEKNLVL